MSCFCPKSPDRRRGFTLMIVIVLIAMVGMTMVVLSGNFRATFYHVRAETDKAQARQLTASAAQWVRLHADQLRAGDGKIITLPAPNSVRATVKVIPSADDSTVEDSTVEDSMIIVEAVVRRASHQITHRRSIRLRAAP